MPNRIEHDNLVTKIVSTGVSQARAERIVFGLSDAQINNALRSATALIAILEADSISM